MLENGGRTLSVGLGTVVDPHCCAIAQHPVRRPGQGFEVLFASFDATQGSSFSIGFLSHGYDFRAHMPIGPTSGTMGIYVHNVAHWCLGPRPCFRVDGGAYKGPLMDAPKPGDSFQFKIVEEGEDKDTSSGGSCRRRPPSVVTSSSSHSRRRLVMEVYRNGAAHLSERVPAGFAFPFEIVCVPSNSCKVVLA